VHKYLEYQQFFEQDQCLPFIPHYCRSYTYFQS